MIAGAEPGRADANPIRYERTGEAGRTLAVAALAAVLLGAVIAIDPTTCFRDDMLSQ